MTAPCFCPNSQAQLLFYDNKSAINYDSPPSSSKLSQNINHTIISNNNAQHQAVITENSNITTFIQFQQSRMKKRKMATLTLLLASLLLLLTHTTLLIFNWIQKGCQVSPSSFLFHLLFILLLLKKSTNTS